MDTGNGYGMRYLLPSVLTLAGVMFIFYIAQLAIYTKNGDKYAMIIKIVGVCGSLALNWWKD